MTPQDFDDPLDMSIYAMQKGDRDFAVMKKRDTWWCRACRHTFRRALVGGPVRWRVYATAGRVRPDLACADCRKRLDALDAVHPSRRTVGMRIQGVDA